MMLRVNLKKLMLTPAFALWQLVLTLFVLMCSPAAIAWLGQQIYMPFSRGVARVIVRNWSIGGGYDRFASSFIYFSEQRRGEKFWPQS